MTITNTKVAIQHIGNGSDTQFDFDFPIQLASDLQVILTGTDGIDYLQELNNEYSVSGVGDDEGGTVTFMTPPASTQTVTIRRMLPLTQVIGLRAQGRIAPEAVEAGQDRVVMMIQQLAYELSRALRLGASDMEGIGNFLGGGNRITNIADPASGQDAVTLATLNDYIEARLDAADALVPQKYSWDADGMTTEFFFYPPVEVASAKAYLVTMQGVVQTPDVDYTVDVERQVLIFSEPPPGGTQVIARTMGYLRGLVPGLTKTITVEAPTSGTVYPICRINRACKVSMLHVVIPGAQVGDRVDLNIKHGTAYPLQSNVFLASQIIQEAQSGYGYSYGFDDREIDAGEMLGLSIASTTGAPPFVSATIYFEED